jgi:ectoine hydroxylase-related dioxygenase (phytanoyl-CoA dioxygenase family)
MGIHQQIQGLHRLGQWPGLAVCEFVKLRSCGKPTYDGPMAILSPELVETYKNDGFVVLRGVISAETQAQIADGVAFNMAHPSSWSNDYTPEGSGGRFFDDYVSWGRIPPFRHVALSGALPQMAGELMGTSHPRFFHEHVLVKEPNTVTPTPWHHDDPYYGVEGFDNVSIWVPLDPAPASVALRCLRGSHLIPRRFIPNRFVDESPYVATAAGFEPFPTVDELEALGETVVCDVEPGDAIAFHYRTLHSAPGTTGHAHRRRIVSFRYVGDDARWITRPWKTSPPFEPNGLNDGDVLDNERFPVIQL